jgi:anti-anti-sigma factor
VSLPGRVGDCRGVPVLHLADALDFSVKEGLEADLALFSRRGDCLMLDLGDVSFVDSAALGLFIGFDIQLGNRGGALAIASLQPPVHRVFEIAGLIRQLHVFDNQDDAARYLLGICRAS